MLFQDESFIIKKILAIFQLQTDKNNTQKR